MLEWSTKLLTVEFVIGVAHVLVTFFAIVWAGRHATKQSQAQYDNSLKLKEIEKLEREIDCLGKIKSMWATLRSEQENFLGNAKLFRKHGGYNLVREYMETDSRKFTDMKELVAALFVATPHNLVKEMQEISIVIDQTRLISQVMIISSGPKAGEKIPSIESIDKALENAIKTFQEFLDGSTDKESAYQEMIDKTKQKIAKLQAK